MNLLSLKAANGFGKSLLRNAKIQGQRNHCWMRGSAVETGRGSLRQSIHPTLQQQRNALRRTLNHWPQPGRYYQIINHRGYRAASSSSSSSSSSSTTTASKENLLQMIFRNLFGKYLILTNTIGSGILMVFGDTIAQTIEMYELRTKTETDSGIKDSMEYDRLRICRMFLVGAVQGPLHHFIYTWMEKLMPVANVRNTFYKILIDQIVLSPLCIIIFFFSACALENKNYDETYDELKGKFLYIYCVDWCVWPIIQYVNFRYLDLKYRVTYVNLCTAIYNIFMSYMKHND